MHDIIDIIDRWTNSLDDYYNEGGKRDQNHLLYII